MASFSAACAAAMSASAASSSAGVRLEPLDRTPRGRELSLRGFASRRDVGVEPRAHLRTNAFEIVRHCCRDRALF